MSFNIRYKTKSWLRSNYIRNNINNTMEHKITTLWNKIKSTRDTFSKIALTKELDDLVTQYKNEL